MLTRTRALLAQASVVSLLAASFFVAGASSASAWDVSECFPAPLGTDVGDLTNGVPDSYATAWNVPLVVASLGVLSNDSGGLSPQSALRAYVSSNPSYGSLALNSNGSFVYTPNITFGPQDRVDTFSYIIYNSSNGQCSAESVPVSISVAGFEETLDSAPLANPDNFPSGGASILGTASLTVAAPGVLANDVNTVTNTVNSNLVANLVAGPVWAGTSISAGTITNWGKRVVDGIERTDNSGGFTFTPSNTGFGTAQFTYQACYFIRGTAEAACSDPATVSIQVDRTLRAAPVTMLVDADGFGSLPLVDFVADTFENDPDFSFSQFRHTHPSSDVGTFAVVGDDYTFQAGAAFTGSITLALLVCDATIADAALGCAPQTTLTILRAAEAPTVTDVVFPTTADGPIFVHFDQPVVGITSGNIRLQVVVSPVSYVDALVTCRSSVTNAPTSCASGADIAVIRPLSPLTPNAYYSLRVNYDPGAQGIFGVALPGLAAVGYQEPFSSSFDLIAPVANPTLSTEAVWSSTPVTVTWNWSDEGASLLSLTECDATTSSTGEGAQTLTGTCSDRAGNTGTASVAVKVDMTAPSLEWVGGPETYTDYDITEVPAAPTCLAIDELSGAGSCEVSNYSAEAGTHIMTATATDLAGNESVETRVYTVGPGDGATSSDTIALGGTVRLTGRGFLPNERVQFWLNSTPLYLGSGFADAGGVVDAMVTIPAQAEPGLHRLEIRGAQSGSVFVEVTVTGSRLASTGSEGAANAAGAAVLLLLVGALLLAVRTTRRPHDRVLPVSRHS